MSVGVDADVIVVGAGPAGSTAARVLAANGIDVVLLDRDEFPRYKTCGGGIIGVSNSRLPLGIPLRERIYEASFTLKSRYHRSHASATPLMSTVSRVELDNWLVNLAIAAGAKFAPKTGLRAALADETCVSVTTTTGKVITSLFLIDASGTSSIIAKRLGVELEGVDLGLEYELVDTTSMNKWRHKVHLDWGSIPGSYGWLFPKGDSLTVGVIAAKGQPNELKAYLGELRKQLGLGGAEVLRSSGHLTHCRKMSSPLASQRILLAGDAAGLLEPWTREGISFATRSGQSAANVLTRAVLGEIDAEAASQLYVEDIQSSLVCEMSAGFKALRAFERHPEVFHILMGYTPIGWKYFTGITTGQSNIADALQDRPVKLGIGALANLPRWHGR